MLVRLKRYSYSETETEGVLTFPDGTRLATIEQPWVPNPNGVKGGKPFESCIPDGMYQLHPWVRPDGAQAYIIVNPDLGVYRLPDQMPLEGGRYLCLIHKANWTTDIQGCIAPGTKRLPMLNPKTNRTEQAVSKSGWAMKTMNDQLGRLRSHILSIESVLGASDV